MGEVYEYPSSSATTPAGLTPIHLDVLGILADSANALTLDALARILDCPPEAVSKELPRLERDRYIERVTAWQPSTGAAYMLGSNYQLTERELALLRDLRHAGGARTIPELAELAGDDEQSITDTMQWLTRNGYLQPITAWRCMPGAFSPAEAFPDFY